jgi:predicted nucleotidyltransferase component of viral defense system
MKQTTYSEQVILLLKILPFVAEHKQFALKGGTAINFYELDMPRLSVDIDLVYIPIQTRKETLSNISDAFQLISKTIKDKLGLTIEEEKYDKTGYVIKLNVLSNNVRVKIEVSPTMRGICYPIRVMVPSDFVQSRFLTSVKIQVISYEELYAGKIAAALARQHPRDLFDIKMLFENGGVTSKMMDALIVDISSNAKSMSDLLDPIHQDFKKAFISKFTGMPIVNVTVEDLEEARLLLIQTVQDNLTDKHKQFLISLKKGSPDYGLINIKCVDKLPAVQWKLMNIKKMPSKTHKKALNKLRSVLEL